MIHQLKDNFLVIKIIDRVKTNDRVGFLFESDNLNVMINKIKSGYNTLENYAKILAETHVQLHNTKITLKAQDIGCKVESLLSKVTSLDTYKDKLVSLYHGIDKKTVFVIMI